MPFALISSRPMNWCDMPKAPSLLREEVAALSHDRLIVVDEIQKAPGLLDEIHYMIQEWQRVFALCGSSARKVRRGHANLLGGASHPV